MSWIQSGVSRRGTVTAVPASRLALVNKASRFRKWLPYVGAVLVAIIAVAGYSTMQGMANSRDWLAHTYEVKSELADLELHRALLHEYGAESPRTASEDGQRRFQSAAAAMREAFVHLKHLTQDNADQQSRLEQLGPMLEQHVQTLKPAGDPVTSLVTSARKPANPRSAGPSDRPSNSRLKPSTADAIEPSAVQDARITAIVGELENQEANLLSIRQTAWDREFRRNILVLAFAVGACLILLFTNIRLLREDIRSSRIATDHNRESADSYRALSARIIGLQDAERRKIGRDLHDSVGQSLAALQMNLDQLALAGGPQSAPLIADSLDLVRRSTQDVRTISHLLHPPLLDVVGFAAAAQNYAQQFARRSGVKANVNLPDELSLPSKEVELVLFRVLQESLTNVHRHAQASTVDIGLVLEDHQAVLKIQDNGKGVPASVIESFKAGVASGVGLGGMRERLADFGGKLEVESSTGGTTVRARVPV
jgi:signal transduction histidine kinase